MLRKKISTLIIALTFIVGAFFMPVNVRAQVYKGADIYEYDNISDYQQLKDDGVQIVIQKATQGLWYSDSLLNYRYTQLTNYGFKIGFYHFASYNSTDPIGEAQHFLSQVKNLHSDTVLWLDIEDGSIPSEVWGKSRTVGFVNQFVKYLENQGYSVGIYTGLSFYYEYLAGNIPTECPLWLASYGKQPTQYPNLVSWQYSESGRLSGVIGDIDLDYFNESIFNSNDYIKSIQHDLQRVNCLSSGEENATGKLDSQTIKAIQEFRYADGLTYNSRIDSELINALNNITRKPTIGIGWTINGDATRYFQWWIGVSKTGVFDGTTIKATKAWQKQNKIWGNPDGIVRQKDWDKILK